jgi:hypothetical protein
MREDRRRRLEARAWKVGGARDFLNLTPPEQACIQPRFTPATGLKARRIEQNVTQNELATTLGSGQSRVAKCRQATPLFQPI